MMMVRLTKYFWIFFLAVALASLPSCFGSKQNTVANPSAPQGPAKVVQTTNTELKFGIPIDCTLGQDCFIMHYQDLDSSPSEVDFGCGRQTYDGHKGTDFAIADETAMAKGVAVKAVAAGKVLRVRDGEPDRRVVDQTTKDAVEDKECGNGVVIDHGNGWETQYCHLRQDSVVAKPDTEVEKGTVLGMVGQSGLASFPHVHLSVRHQGKPVDPFSGPVREQGCQVEKTSLWEQPLSYVPTGLIRAGFALEPPQMDDIWKGRFAETTLSKDAPALIFWTQTYGVLEGDIQQMKLSDPNGNVIANDQRTLEKPSRVWLSFVGKKNNPQRPLVAGDWTAEYQLIREGKVLVDVKRNLQLE